MANKNPVITPELKANAGRWKDPKNLPTSEVKVKAWKDWRDRKQMADDIFKKITKLGMIDTGIKNINEKLKNGDTKDLIDILKLIIVKESQTDITSEGKEIKAIAIVPTKEDADKWGK